MGKLPSRANVVEASQAEPDGFQSGLAIAFAAEEAAESGDETDGFLQGGWRSRQRLARRCRCTQRLPFVRPEYARARAVRIVTSFVGKPHQPPGHNQVASKGSFQPLLRFQLQGFDPTTALKHIMQSLAAPAIGVPHEKTHGIVPTFYRKRGRQQPADGCLAPRG